MNKFDTTVPEILAGIGYDAQWADSSARGALVKAKYQAIASLLSNSVVSLAEVDSAYLCDGGLKGAIWLRFASEYRKHPPALQGEPDGSLTNDL